MAAHHQWQNSAVDRERISDERLQAALETVRGGCGSVGPCGSLEADLLEKKMKHDIKNSAPHPANRFAHASARYSLSTASDHTHLSEIV